jgi:hypothetical protein
MQDVDAMLREINALSAQAELLALSVAVEAARAAGSTEAGSDPTPAEMAALLEKMRQQAAAIDRMARWLSALANASGGEPLQLGGGAALRDAAHELKRSLRVPHGAAVHKRSGGEERRG